MSARHHYVSQFHLRGFTELARPAGHEPALWVGDRETGKTYRRAPKKLAWSRGMFDGPGALANQTSSLETFLSTKVEGPAAPALAQFITRPSGCRGSVPPELFRYICWAAARSLPMQQLFEMWLRTLSPSLEVLEPPPPGYEQIQRRKGLHRMTDTNGIEYGNIPADEIQSLREKGWHLCVGPNEFLEFVHLQAWYFEVRMFPRLQWEILDAPQGKFFVIADRPVVWGFDGFSDVPPSALRDPLCQMAVPLTRSLALFAFHASAPRQEAIAPEDINRITASGAREWIAGPTESVVQESLAILRERPLAQ
jgi:Protein of unknown function (DUF4238)